MELTSMGDYKIRLSSIDSTNDYAVSMFTLARPVEGTVVIADFQEKGRGQLQAAWESEKGKNLLTSFILYPRIDLSDFFILNQCVSLAVRDAVRHVLPECTVSVKWPNDILVNDRKIAGILIENSIRGNQFVYSVAGIGINVNQERFAFYRPQATSLKLESGSDESLDDVLQVLCDALSGWYTRLKLDHKAEISREYLSAFFGLGVARTFVDADGRFEAVIEGVREDGKLILRMTDGSGVLRHAGFKDVRFVF